MWNIIGISHQWQRKKQAHVNTKGTNYIFIHCTAVLFLKCCHVTVVPWCFHINAFSLMLFLGMCIPVEKQIQLHKINGLYRPGNKMWLNLEQTIIYPGRPLGIITLTMWTQAMLWSTAWQLQLLPWHCHDHACNTEISSLCPYSDVHK